MSFKLISMVIIAGLFFGCASKEEEKLMGDFSKKTPNFQEIQQTQKAVFVQNNKVVWLVVATYLQPKNNTQTSNQYEKFILGIYSDDVAVPQAMLNSKEAINITKIDNNDLKLEGLALRSKWSKYYMVSFMPDDSEELELKVSLGRLGSKELIFSKKSGFIK
jgi:hypothetical protein